jgi:MscS family membrane protein
MKLLIVYLLCFLVHFSFGQEVELSNPRASIENLFEYLTDDNYHPELAAKSLFQGKLSSDEIEKRARQLVQIYNGLGVGIQFSKISINPNFININTSASEVQIDSLLTDIYVEKYGDVWLIKESSVESIPSLYNNTYPFGTGELLNWLSTLSHKHFLGLKVWQSVGLVFIIGLCFLIHRLFTFILDKILVKSIVRFGKKDLAEQYINPVAKPISLLLVAYVLTVLVPVLQFDILFSHYLIILLKSSVPLFVTVVMYKLVDVLAIYMAKLADKTDTTLDDQLVPLLKKTLKVFVLLVGTLFVLQNFNFDVTALLAGLSIGGLAFALAAQDMLKNLFGSIMIFVDRPFQIGDWIVGNGLDGDVEEVGFRSTRIRTFHNSVVSVPNGLIADMTIDNMGLRKYRRYKTVLAITYDTPPASIDAFVLGLKKIVDSHPSTRKDYYNVYLNTFGASSLDILFYIFFEVNTWPEELQARHEVNLSIIKLADELGVRFAFNTQTIHIEDFPEKKSLTPQDYLSKKQLKEKVSSFEFTR